MTAERPFDHGVLNLPLGHRGRGKSLERTIDDAVKEVARIKAAEWDALRERARAAAVAEKARVKMTAEDVRGNRYVRDQFGWHAVVRVSQKSVTVKTPYSWTDRLPLTKILEVKA